MTDPILPATPSISADRLEAAVVAILALRPALKAGSPWPLASAWGTEPEASWGPPEVLAHLDEMLPYWLGEVERILDTGTSGRAADPVPFGRTVDDPLRVGVIGRDRTVPLRELLARLEVSSARVARRMRSMSAADAARLGLHPVRGAVSIAFIFERFVAGHAEDHLAQLRSTLGDARD